jgi:hypothetical protein
MGQLACTWRSVKTFENSMEAWTKVMGTDMLVWVRPGFQRAKDPGSNGFHSLELENLSVFQFHSLAYVSQPLKTYLAFYIWAPKYDRNISEPSTYCTSEHISWNAALLSQWSIVKLSFIVQESCLRSKQVNTSVYL